MKHQLEMLQCNPNIIEQEKDTLFNLKFKREDVVVFDKPMLLPPSHNARRLPRYQTFIGGLQPETINEIQSSKKRKGSQKLKSTKPRSRGGSSSTVYEPYMTKYKMLFTII